jgi:hypothetical protein
MFWIFIHVDRTLISINWICVGYLFVLIRLQILSTLIDLGCLFLRRIELQILSTEYALDIYQLDTSPILFMEICFGYFNLIRLSFLFMEICFGYLSTWYVSGFYQHWYYSKIYQVNMFEILFLRIELQILSELIEFQNLSTLICLKYFINANRTPKSINTNRFWDIYQRW